MAKGPREAEGGGGRARHDDDVAAINPLVPRGQKIKIRQFALADFYRLNLNNFDDFEFRFRF